MGITLQPVWLRERHASFMSALLDPRLGGYEVLQPWLLDLTDNNGVDRILGASHFSHDKGRVDIFLFVLEEDVANPFEPRDVSHAVYTNARKLVTEYGARECLFILVYRWADGSAMARSDRSLKSELSMELRIKSGSQRIIAESLDWKNQGLLELIDGIFFLMDHMVQEFRAQYADFHHAPAC